SLWLRDEATSAEARARVDDLLREAEVLYVARVPANLPQRGPRLKWVQFVGTGIDSLVAAGALSGPYTVTNVTGTNALPIAEHCFLFMLMFVKRARAFLAQQQEHAYQRDAVRPDFIEGKTLGVLGLGGIGLEVARLGKGFRMRVLGTRRSAQARQRDVGDVDELYPPAELHDLLAQCDFVVMALPLTDETRGAFGEAELRAMKSSAYLINVGRGKLIDEAALVRALQDGQIAGAGLDVFATEPLPPDSPLWEMPNVIMTPHVAGDLIDNRLRATRFFCENLRRYLAGEPLRNVIDLARGY
ncbi:MAG: D-2-hydroxyacid dehydrogenase, partial [Dehalococcoidia bacterium]